MEDQTGGPESFVCTCVGVSAFYWTEYARCLAAPVLQSTESLRRLCVCAKQLIRALEEARGNGTSMISLIIPPRDQARALMK